MNKKTSELIQQMDNFDKKGELIVYFVAFRTMIATIGILIIAQLFGPIHSGYFIIAFMTLLLYMIMRSQFSNVEILQNRIFNSIKEKNIDIGETKYKVENIGDILRISDDLFRLIQKLSQFHYFLKTCYPEKIEDYNKILNMQYLIILSILTDLRSDLATRLSEQQQILEGAKSEIEQNITGTPELLAVSETQRVRLDRQIGQFEELQRVLVRV